MSGKEKKQEVDMSNNLNEIIVEFNQEIKNRQSIAVSSSGIVSDVVIKSYLNGQADAYEFCVNEFMTRIRAAQ